MGLLPKDEKYLEDRKYKYEIHEETNQTLLVIKGYELSELYDHSYVDILIKIPKGYPINQLDMFWVYPHLKFKSTGQYLPQANVMETYLNLQWQRFSRHYTWKPTYALSTHMNIIKESLKS